MEQRKILLVGKTGNGKSSAGNTILRKKVFTPKAAANSATAKPVTGHGVVNGRQITVIDTPGFFDTDQDNMKTKSEIIKALTECAPAIHAIVLVLKVERYTSQENEVVKQFLNLMKGEDVLKHTVILFTFGEQLEDQTLEEFVKSNPKLQEFSEKCEGRRHVIDNKYWNDCRSGEKSNSVQVNNLLDTIDEMVQKNGCFTTELLQAVDKMVQKEMKKHDNLSPEEKREKAKEIVYSKFWKQFAGVTTGVMIGALLGVSVALISLMLPYKYLQAAAAAAAAKAAGGAGGAAAAGAAAATCGGAAAETATLAGGAGAASAGAGLSTGFAVTAGVFGVAAAVGAAGGAITGWKAAEEADSVYDAMMKSANTNYENAMSVVEKVQNFASLGFNNKS